MEITVQSSALEFLTKILNRFQTRPCHMTLAMQTLHMPSLNLNPKLSFTQKQALVILITPCLFWIAECIKKTILVLIYPIYIKVDLQPWTNNCRQIHESMENRFSNRTFYSWFFAIFQRNRQNFPIGWPKHFRDFLENS